MGSFSKKELYEFAVIYLRVSSEKQVREGHGLESQETRCRAYAKYKGYGVVGVFKDGAVSGGSINKEGMQSLLSFLDTLPKGAKTVVIVDDIKRFSRDVRLHFDQKDELIKRGARLESPSFSFDETPEGHFVETLMAANAELERRQNQKQVINRMKARLEAGYWPFPATPPGYVFVKNKSQGKVLGIQEPIASIVKEALEGFAVGIFPTQSAVQQFLQSENYSNTVHVQAVARLLGRALFYAGYIEYPKWEVTSRKGQHQPIISTITYDQIKARLAGKARSHIRRDSNPNFPLRSFVACERCKILLTGAMTKGRTKYYPLYRGQGKGCLCYNKSIPKNIIEADFEKLLKTIQPTNEMLTFSKAMLIERWNNKMAIVKNGAEKIRKEAEQVNKQIESYVSLAGAAKSNEVIKRYEEKITALENMHIQLKEELQKKEPANFDFETALTQVTNYIGFPLKIWQNGDFGNQLLLLKVLFAQPISYGIDKGFGTANFSLTYEFISGRIFTEKQDVDMGGIEPP